MKLTITKGGEAGREIEPDARFEIGRDKSADLVLDNDDEVSRKHAYLEPSSEGELELGDLESRNGTFVNGRRIKKPVQLKNGDKVRIGKTEFEVEGEDAGRTVLASAPPEKQTSQRKQPPPPPPPKKPAEKPPQFPAPQGSRSSSPSGVREALTKRSRRATGIAIGAVVIAAIVIAVAVSGVLGGDDPATTAEIAEAATPSTVFVEADQAGERAGSGTGWVYNAEEGLIVTNSHVVAPGQTFKVGVDGQFQEAQLLGVAPCEDLAVLQVSQTDGLETLPLASGEISQGDSVVALGYPVNAAAADELIVTTGTVSLAGTGVGDFQAPNLPPYPDVVQTDAAINPGNSGGPLINDEMELVGVNSAGVDAGLQQNTNYAASVNRVKEVVPQLAEGDSVGYLGFGFDVPAEGVGLVILGAPDSTTSGQQGANDAAGALITSIDGQPVTTFTDYCKLVRDLQPGDPVTLEASTGVTARVAVE